MNGSHSAFTVNAMLGQTISHYKIIEKLGQGGMGVVYKAQDTTLNRFVALKFLPPDLTRDPEAMERFVNEAQAASALDHPNICTIHEIGETAEGRRFICMAYYEGETVEKKVVSHQLSVDSAIDIAMQVARGLERAHEAGVIHRDIKPSNLIITKRGEVKIIDFGLAKLMSRTRLTKTGTTLGTVAYMSPEQLQAEAIDHRADIWSLGVVLFEMLSGHLPFRGDYEAAMIYSIVNEKPVPLIQHNAEASEGWQRIIDKALAKHPETRYQQVGELLADLAAEKRGASELIKPIRQVKRSSKVKPAKIAFVATTILAALIVSLSLFNRQPAKKALPTHKQVTFVGDASYPAISPDGQFIAYVTGKERVEQKVMVQDLAGGQPLEAFRELVCGQLQWSPNGTELLLFAGNDSTAGTFIVPRLGGRARRIRHFGCMSWSPDGSQIAGAFSDSSQVWFINKATGNERFITLNVNVPLVTLYDLHWSPAGHLLLFGASEQRGDAIWTVTTNGKQQYQVVADSLEFHSPRWSLKGDAIYYFRVNGQSKDLMKIAVHPETGKPKGPASILMTGLQAGEYFTISKNVKCLLYTRKLEYSNLWLVTLEGSDGNPMVKTKQLTTGTSVILRPSISPDGKQIAFSIGAHLTNANIFTMPIAGGAIQQITFLNSFNMGPVWSPDGREIAFGSTQSRRPQVWKVNANGGTPRQFAQSELSENFMLSWSPGSDILYQKPGLRFHLLNPKTEEERPLLVNNDLLAYVHNASFSPDAKNVAVYGIRNPVEQDSNGVWVVFRENSSQVFLHQCADAQPMGWSADGNWIYAAEGIGNKLNIIMIHATRAEVRVLATLPYAPDVWYLLYIFGMNNITSDGKQLVYPVFETKSDVWLMENFDPEVE